MNRSLTTVAAVLAIASLGLVACSDDKNDSASPSTGKIDCGNMFSTMSAITTENLVALVDDKVIVPNEAVLPLIRADAASASVVAITDAVSGALDTDALKAMMVEVEVDKKAPDVVAGEFVATLATPMIAASPETVVVGSADFPESQLLAEIYGQALEATGHTVEYKTAIGSREIYYKAILDGEVDLLPEYTNSLLSFVLRQADASALPTATNVEEQIAALGDALPDTLVVGAPSTAEDKDVIVCGKAVADAYGLTTLSDLAKVADKINLGAPPEFETRAPFGLVGFKEIYGATFKSFVPLSVGDIPAAINGNS